MTVLRRLVVRLGGGNDTCVWMNLLAPLLAPAFRWNHGQVMAQGGHGLAQYLGVPLLPD